MSSNDSTKILYKQLYKQCIVAVPGDPVLRASIDGQEVVAREGLIWYYDELYEWVSVCGDAMGYMEAQVLCSSLEFPYFTFLQSSHR